jgi:hypothetical protein
MQISGPAFLTVWLVCFGLMLLFVIRGLPFPCIRTTIHYKNSVLYKIKSSFMLCCLLLLGIMMCFTFIQSQQTTAINNRGRGLLLIVLLEFVLLKGKWCNYNCVSSFGQRVYLSASEIQRWRLWDGLMEWIHHCSRYIPRSKRLVKLHPRLHSLFKHCQFMRLLQNNQYILSKQSWIHGRQWN